MVLLIIGLVLVALTVFEVVTRQVWIRIIYVWGVTIYRDDNPVLYWVIVGLQAAAAGGCILGGVASLLRR